MRKKNPNYSLGFRTRLTSYRFDYVLTVNRGKPELLDVVFCICASSQNLWIDIRTPSADSE